MLIYKTFNGHIYNSKEEYDEVIESLLNKPINNFRYYELNNYLLEYMPIEKILNNGKQDKSWTSLFHFDYNNNCFIRIMFDVTCTSEIYYLSISYRMEPNFNVNTGFENYNHMFLHVEYPICSTLLLKDLIHECEIGIKKTLEYWKNNVLPELTKSVNTNFKNIGDIKCKNK